MKCFLGLLAVAWAFTASGTVVGGSIADDQSDNDDEVHHHHHHGHHHRHKKHQNATDKESATPVAAKPEVTWVEKPEVVKSAVQSTSIVDRMKKLEAELAEKAKQQASQAKNGHILVNGPLPADFNERFAQAVGHATGADPNKVQVTKTKPLEDNQDIVEVEFVAPAKTVRAVEDDAADPNSKLANGNLRPFLVAKSKDSSMDAAAWHAEKWESDRLAAEAAKKEQQALAKAQPKENYDQPKLPQPIEPGKVKELKAEPEEPRDEEPQHHIPRGQQEATPIEEKGIDIDTQMPYGDLEPFGREDTAQELTESSVKESDEMVDQLERAEVAEEKRAVFRALTRLRGAAITSFDGVARSQTGNIDEYNKIHKWRKTHPLHHLADEESDVTKWAFPDNADFIQLGVKA